MDDQKTQELQNLANVVAVRNHLSTLLNSGKSLDRKDFQPIGHLIKKMDAMLVQSSLVLFKDEAAEVVDDGLNIAEKIRQAKMDLAKQASAPEPAAAAPVETPPVQIDADTEKEVKLAPNRKKGVIARAK